MSPIHIFRIKQARAHYLCLLLTLAAPPIIADVLLIDTLQQAPENSVSGLPRPTHGMTMHEVESIFGEPVRRFPAIGTPPITRWEYDGYAVVFEGDRVIHAVVHRPSPARGR